MTKSDSEFNQSGSRVDLSRARQRQMKREQQPGTASPAAERSNRRRASARGGSSARERLVAARVKLSGPASISIQEKLGEKLGRFTQPPEDDQPRRRLTSGSGTTTSKRGGRKKETGWSGSRYESSAHAESQRKNQADGGVMPRRSRRSFDARSEAVPPVMVRGGMGGMTFGRNASSKHKQKTPRRRYDVPLRVQGAEVRLPSIPFINLGWRAISLLMVIMMTASLFLMWKAPVFQVKAMEAEGLKRLTLTDLNAVMRTSGSSVFSLDPVVLKTNLEQAFPEFSSIKVRIGLPASVNVAVTERVPVIAWTQDGSEVWLDSEGVAFPVRGTPEAELIKVTGYGTPPNIKEPEVESETQNLLPGFPYSTGAPSPKIRLAPELVAAILALGAKLPVDTAVVYDSEHGLGWNDPKGWEVYFGTEDQDMEMKLSVYQALVERLQNEGIQPELISVEFVHAPYYRMER